MLELNLEALNHCLEMTQAEVFEKTAVAFYHMASNEALIYKERKYLKKKKKYERMEGPLRIVSSNTRHIKTNGNGVHETLQTQW